MTDAIEVLRLVLTKLKTINGLLEQNPLLASRSDRSVLLEVQTRLENRLKGAE